LLPRFMWESRIRWYLQGLYDAVVFSTDNARTLMEKDPHEISPDAGRGPEIAVRGFEGIVSWLRLLKEFTKPGLFEDQFLYPLRAPASFIVNVRGGKNYTTCLEGMVFQKSRSFYHELFGAKVCDVSIIVPQLESALCLRCREEEAKNLGYGFYRLDSVQPLPVVNRIHPIQLRMTPLPSISSLSTFDFLKVSMIDVGHLQESLVFENMCQVATEQNVSSAEGGGRNVRIGFPCIFSGYVRSVSGSQLTLGDLCSSSYHTFRVSQQLLRSLNTDLYRIRELKGSLVRCFGVVWNKCGPQHFTPELPVIISAEKSDDRDCLILDDLTGFIRLRGTVQKTRVIKRYGNVDLGEMRITERNGILEYDEHAPSSSDSVIRLFHEEMRVIRRLRKNSIGQLGETGPLVLISQVMDMQKLKKDGLADLIRRCKGLKRCLLAIIGRRDSVGVPPSIKELTLTWGMDAKRKIRWLIDLGLLTEPSKDKPITLTKRAVETAWLVVKHRLLAKLERMLQASKVILLPYLEKGGVPASLLLHALEVLKGKGLVRCLQIDGEECKLVWLTMQAGDEDRQEAEHSLAAWKDAVLEILGEVHHPLHTMKIAEEMQRRGYPFGYKTMKLLMKGVGRSGEVEKGEEREMWFYPPKNRIVRLLKSNPHNAFTIEEIASAIAPPSLDAKLVTELLMKLEKEGKAERLGEAMWGVPLTSPSEERERIERLLIAEAERYALRILKDRAKLHEMQAKLMIYLINLIGRMRPSKKPRIPANRLAEETLNQMQQKGEISIENGWIKRET